MNPNQIVLSVIFIFVALFWTLHAHELYLESKNSRKAKEKFHDFLIQTAIVVVVVMLSLAFQEFLFDHCHGRKIPGIKCPPPKFRWPSTWF